MELLIFVVLLIFAEFCNGWTDAPNVIAPLTATKTLSWNAAVGIAVFGNVIGALCSGQTVAKTVGKDLLRGDLITLNTLMAALLGAIVCSILAAKLRFGISKSHALYGGLVGAGFVSGGFHALIGAGWTKVLDGVCISFFCGLIPCLLIVALLKATMPRERLANRAIPWLQCLFAFFVALVHGANDGQKYMGILTQGLVKGHALSSFLVPMEVIVGCSIVMGLGTLVGGRGIARRTPEDYGVKEPYAAAVVSFVSAAVLLAATRFGIPQSTTHTVNCGSIGAGAASAIGDVKWRVICQVLAAWVLTPVISALVAGTLAFILRA